MKSQAALEYLLVVGLSLAVIIPVFYYSLTHSSDSIAVSQAQNTVNTLAKAADYVYSLGEGSSSKVLISIPKNVLNTSTQNKTISIRLQTSSGISDITATTKATVSGTLPNVSGNYNIFVNMTGGIVDIRRGG